MGCGSDITSFIIFIAFILLIVWIYTIVRNRHMRKQQRQYANAMAKANADGIQMAERVTGQGEGGEGITDFDV